MNLLSEESKLTLIESGNYNYYGFKVVSATIDTSSLERCSQGIKWNPTTINKGKVCNYTATLQDKQGSTFTIEDSLIIKDIIETKQTNPSLVLQDIPTNVVAGLDLEIQTSSFLNAQATVMSKVLGCTIYNKKDREKYIHCAIPTIHNYEPIYPTLYMILSDKSIYIGITYRNLYERISEHCTLTKDKTVKANKSTYDMLAYENAEVYCIGEFHDYTLAEIEAMSEDEKNDYFHKMEQVETIMISIASREFTHLELVNRKQIINDSDELKAKVLELSSDLSFNINWECWDNTHEVDNLVRYSEELENVARYVYQLRHGVEMSDSLLSLHETAGVTARDLAYLVNDITKPQPRSFGRVGIDYYNPTEMPQGRARGRFDGYFGYKFNPNPTFKKSKPYYKKGMFGWDNKSPKEMQEMVQEHLDELHEQRRLYQATISNDGMFRVRSMNKGEVSEEVIFEQYLEDYHVKPRVVYVNVAKKKTKENRYNIPATHQEVKLKSLDDIFAEWTEEDEEAMKHDLSFLRLHKSATKVV